MYNKWSHFDYRNSHLEMQFVQSGVESADMDVHTRRVIPGVFSSFVVDSRHLSTLVGHGWSCSAWNVVDFDLLSPMAALTSVCSGSWLLIVICNGKYAAEQGQARIHLKHVTNPLPIQSNIKTYECLTELPVVVSTSRHSIYIVPFIHVFNLI